MHDILIRNTRMRKQRAEYLKIQYPVEAGVTVRCMSILREIPRCSGYYWPERCMEPLQDKRRSFMIMNK